MQTKQFLNNNEFDELYQKLSATHNQLTPNISNKRLQFLGLVIVRFQRLEYTIREFIIYFLSFRGVDQKIGNTLVMSLSFKDLVNTLEEVASTCNYNRLNNLKKLLRMAMQAEQIRNQIVHSIWTSGPRMKLSKKNAGNYDFKHYSDEELKNIPEQMYKIYNGLEALKWLDIG